MTNMSIITTVSHRGFFKLICTMLEELTTITWKGGDPIEITTHEILDYCDKHRQKVQFLTHGEGDSYIEWGVTNELVESHLRVSHLEFVYKIMMEHRKPSHKIIHTPDIPGWAL